MIVFLTMTEHTHLGAEPQRAEDLRHEHDVREPVYCRQQPRLLELDVVHRQLRFPELRPLLALNRGGVGWHVAQQPPGQHRDGIARAGGAAGD